MHHFLNHVKPTGTGDLPVLLIMDNHESHVSFDSIKLAKRNNVVLLTLPPHTSHRLQPLDRGVYGPLKQYHSNECQKWLLRYPGKMITIYEIAELLGEAYPLAFCPKSIISAFKSTGIYPYNENVFSDDDSLAASVV
ncbi:hypothetical protein JTB14_032828 [Gonioctena quinquepunctata]|nr:hypothetical protein JTB14_032828 [Gonioctena quinquepunctata]